MTYWATTFRDRSRSGHIRRVLEVVGVRLSDVPSPREYRIYGWKPGSTGTGRGREYGDRELRRFLADDLAGELFGRSRAGDRAKIVRDRILDAAERYDRIWLVDGSVDDDFDYDDLLPALHSGRIVAKIDVVW